MIPWDNLPAADMIREGLADLAAIRESVASYLVQIGSLKMRRCASKWPFRTRMPSTPIIDAMLC
jgi:hypothetical protein